MKPIWLVVANQTQARIFSAETSTFANLTEIEDLTQPLSRFHDREITSDLPGKIRSVTAGGHALEAPTDPKKHNIDNFAHRLAQRLENAYNAHAFYSLGIIAEPTFLGLLRACLSEQLKKSICFEQDANLAHCTVKDIASHLPAHLPLKECSL